MYVENAPAVHIQVFEDNCLQVESNIIVITLAFNLIN